MSDLFETRSKIEEGASWRGNINVNIDDEEKELSVRQLRDPEFWEVMELIDREALRSLKSELNEEKMDEYQELRESEDLDEDEKERLKELQHELEDESVDIFDRLDHDTFMGVRQAAKYGVVPDEADKREALIEKGDHIEEQYGYEPTSSEDTEEYLNDEIARMMDRSTRFVSFTIGIQVLRETMGDSGK
jgi:hypothetical protein